MCWKPIKAMQYIPHTGKSVIKMGWKSTTLKATSPYVEAKKIELPCQKCSICKMKKAREWGIRSQIEAENYSSNQFITLTYNKENLPMARYEDPITGEIKFKETLNKEHLQKFIKKVRNYYLRKYKHTGIKFFGCGEYGSKTGRPHYHLIMYNLPMFDLKHKYTNGITKIEYYTSKTLENFWGKGHVLITEANTTTAEYTAKYTAKRENHIKAGEGGRIKLNWYEMEQIQKPYLTMSNGIGKKHLEDNLEYILDNDRIVIKKDNKIVYIKTFKYYIQLLEKWGYEEWIKKIKIKRETEMFEANLELQERYNLTNDHLKNIENYFADKEINKMRAYEYQTMKK